MYSAISRYEPGAQFYIYKMSGQTPKLVASQFEPRFNFSTIVTLNAGDGLMLGLVQDYSGLPDQAFLLAMSVNPATYAITFGAPELYANDGFSVNGQIAAVSNFTFSMIYYSGVDALTRYGKYYNHILLCLGC